MNKLQFYKNKIASLYVLSFQTLLNNKQFDEIAVIIQDYYHLIEAETFTITNWNMSDIFILYNTVEHNDSTKLFFQKYFNDLWFSNITELKKYKTLSWLVKTIETDKEMFEEIFVHKHFDITTCKNLYELNLSNSKIEEMPNLSHLEQIKVLNISDNILLEFNSMLMPKNIHTLIANNIFGRYISDYDRCVIKDMLQLQTVEYNDNNFNGYIENLPKLRNLSLLNHRIKRPFHVLNNFFRCTKSCNAFCTCAFLYKADFNSSYWDCDPTTYNFDIIEYSNMNDYITNTNNTFNLTDYIVLVIRKINDFTKLGNEREVLRLKKFSDEIIKDNEHLLNLNKIRDLVNDRSYEVNIYPDIPGPRDYDDEDEW